MKHSTPILSVVVPSYNEEANVVTFYKHLTNELKKISDLSYEIIYIDDGSSDQTLKKLRELAQKDAHIKVIAFSRNFGKEIATTAGITHANGQAIVMIDADGQHPPELIHTFLQKWRDGAQVVVGVRERNQKEGIIKKFGSKLFYPLINSIADIQLIPRSTDFRLIDREVRDAFVQFTERNRVTRGLIDWTGYRKASVEFVANARMAGAPAYSVGKLIKLAMHSFVSLSLAPLYFSGYAGLVITPLSFLLGIFVLVEQLVLNDPLGLRFTGTAMLGVLLLFLVGLLLMSQGFIALYISHIHSETQNRPLYIIDRSRSVGL